jgi:hypothetical protein
MDVVLWSKLDPRKIMSGKAKRCVCNVLVCGFPDLRRVDFVNGVHYVFQ